MTKRGRRNIDAGVPSQPPTLTVVWMMRILHPASVPSWKGLAVVPAGPTTVMRVALTMDAM
jgi:hypothetical protein